ncbi:hypothetical protein SCUCBS95973_008377 [Sporothrix curviconia]|uniref:Phospholipase/carboxylesterase/thioesterase domain-containing protein n=1 Tax=Sporothrix curviconia TaxID=1260050 RepID=A0ABP0CL33_9PEZI
MDHNSTSGRRRKVDAPSPPPYVVEPTAEHTHSIVLLHGMGSNGEKFGQELLDTGKTADGRTLASNFPGARLIFPTSRWRRSSAFKRAVITQWFDVASMQDRALRNDKKLPGLRESFREVLAIIESECKAGIPRSNIVLGGLSNGCAMSLICTIALGGSIGGFVGMSGYLPFQDEMDAAMAASERHKAAAGRKYVRGLLEWEETPEEGAAKLPVFLGHGSDDEKLNVIFGEEASQAMAQLGFDVEWRRYEGLGHWYKIPDEIDDVVKFMHDKCGWAKSEKPSAGIKDIDKLAGMVAATSISED